MGSISTTYNLHNTKMSKKNSHFSSEKFIPTKLQLAGLLNISRTTLDSYTTLPNFPEKQEAGWPLSECRKFVEGRLNRDEAARTLKLLKLRNDVAIQQVQLAKLADAMMPIEMVKMCLENWAISVGRIIQSSDLTDAQKEHLTSQIEGIDSSEFMAAGGEQ